MATLLLISRFYELWKAGPGSDSAKALGHAQEWLGTSTAQQLLTYVPAEALETVAGRLLASAPPDSRPYQHPWCWTPFFLVGA